MPRVKNQSQLVLPNVDSSCTGRKLPRASHNRARQPDNFGCTERRVAEIGSYVGKSNPRPLHPTKGLRNHYPSIHPSIHPSIFIALGSAVSYILHWLTKTVVRQTHTPNTLPLPHLASKSAQVVFGEMGGQSHVEPPQR